MKSKYWAAYWTVIAWVLTNIPLALVFYKYEGDVDTKLIMLAPNQFLFLLIFFPAGVYLTVEGVKALAPLIAKKLRKNLFIASWVFAVLGAGVVTYFDYQSEEPADYYQLTPSAAEKAAAAIDVFLVELQVKKEKEPKKKLIKFANEIREENNPKESIPTASLIEIANEILENAKARAETRARVRAMAESSNADTLDRGKGISLKEASRYLWLVNDSQLQKKFNLVDPFLRGANVVELLAATIVAMQLIFWVVITFLVRYTPKYFISDQGNEIEHKQLITPATRLLGAVGFSLFFAFGTGFNLKVRALLGLNVGTTMQGDVVTAVLFLVMTVYLIVVLVKDQHLEFLRKFFPALTGIVVYLIGSFWFDAVFEYFVSTENPGTWFFAVFICILMASGLFVFFMGGADSSGNRRPRHQDQTNQGNN
ncbi:MAG: hypothetical protein IH886_13315 [Nitrospinae bacterium]|nr:hypothetical protein [Nitrospinota bacterium]